MNGLVDQGLINDFIEPDLLLMESSGDALPQDTINRIFRAIHSIKGTSGFLELDSVKQLNHVMENLLMKIRDGEMSPNPEIVNALLKGADKLRVMIESVDSCSLIPIDGELASLNVFLEGRCSCIAQPRESCAVYGMSRSVCKAGLSDEQAPLSMLAPSVAAIIGDHRQAGL